MSLIITRKVSVTGGTVLRAANNLGDVGSFASARANLGVYSQAEVAAQRNALAPAQALSFNGTADASVAAIPAFGTGDFSVAILVNPAALTTNHGLIGGLLNSFGLYATATGAVGVWKTNVAIVGTSAAGTLTVNTPTLLTYTRSGTSGVLYANGISVLAVTDSQDYSVATTTLNSATAVVRFTGTLRLLGIAKRALSASEVLSLYQTSTWKVDSDTLVCPDPMQPGNGLTWGDRSGNGAHILLPASGVDWLLPSAAVNKLRGTTSTSGNQQLLGGPTLNANTQITRVRARSRSGTPSITLGTASGGSQIVASVALSTTWKDLTIALTGGIISTASSVWVGSSTADVVEIDLTHEPLGY